MLAVKKINHTFKRDIKSNFSYYVSITLLTMLTIFLAAVAFSDADMIKEDIQYFMDTYMVEDAQFQTAVTLSEDDIDKLEEEYDVLIEETAYMDAEDGEKTFRIFKPMEKVNKYQLLEGDEIQKEQEILFDRDFVDTNALEIGDTYTVDGVSFEIAGLAVRPDYLYSKKSLNDAWIDKENFGMIQVTEEAYEELLEENDWNESVYYSVVYNDQEKIEDFRTELYEEYHAYQYLAAEANSRIETPKGAGDEIFMQACCLAPILFIVIMMLVSVVIGRMMDREKKYIGTLTALGYRGREISFHYSIYAIIPGILGGILGVLLAIVAGKGVAMYFVVDYQKINYNYYIRPAVAVICLLIPVLLYGIVAYTKSVRMLRKNVVSMLLDRDDSKKKKRHMLEQSKMNFRKKFQIREMFAHIGRTILVLFCLFLSAFLCLFGFSMKDTVDNLTEKGVESAAIYPYTYYLNHMESEEEYDGLHGLSVSYEMENNGNLITVNGVPADSAFADMELLEGKYVEDGYYISNAISVEQDLHLDDTLTIVNTITLEETKITIDGIVNDNTQQVLYTSYNNLVEITGVEDGTYNVVYSDEELDIDSDEVAYVSDSDSLLDTLNNAMTAMNGFVYGMMFMGCLLSIVSVYLIVNMLIEENKSNISMLKVLGYRNKEINKIVLNTNHILVLVGFVLAVPVAVASMNVLCVGMISMMHVVMTPIIQPTSILICAVIVLISYMLSLLLLRRKVDKVDMVVSLKGNRE